MLDIPIGTVMSRLHRGRKAMQKALFDYAHARGLAGQPAGGPGARNRRWLTATTHSESSRRSSTTS